MERTAEKPKVETETREQRINRLTEANLLLCDEHGPTRAIRRLVGIIVDQRDRIKELEEVAK